MNKENLNLQGAQTGRIPAKLEKPILTSVNFDSVGLKRYRYDTNTNALTSMIYNFRRAISDAGFDCSLLNDSEILAFSTEVDSQGDALIDNPTELKEFLGAL